MNLKKCAFGVSTGKFLGFLNLMVKLPTIFVPVRGRPLKVYLCTFDKAMSALVVQDDQEGKSNQSTMSVESSKAPSQVPSGQVATAQEIEEEWTLYFDNSSTVEEVGASIVLRDDKGHDTVFSLKLDFQCTNNTAEYEAYLIGLAMAKEAGVQCLKIIGDSGLILAKFKNLSGYVIISHELYYCLSSGILARCISDKKAYHRLRKIHDRTCGYDSRISLYHRIQ
ncbi:hypothetical protein SLE2022_333270 [Rubroshorea leprosula]